MKNKRFYTNLTIAVIAISGTLYGVQNCGKFKPLESSLQNALNTTVVAETTYVQIERLGRPAVNEGLLVSNNKLVAFNSIPPTLDLATDNPAVLEVLTEASFALDLVDSLEGTNTFGDGFNSEVVTGFLPDVMRIDTSKAIPPGTAAYNGDFVLVRGTKAAMLTGGRKIEDDVIDITLSYLVAGDPSGGTIKDNVSYQGTAGNSSQGHKLLNGQTSYGGPATWPFLATPY